MLIANQLKNLPKRKDGCYYNVIYGDEAVILTEHEKSGDPTDRVIFITEDKIMDNTAV